MPGAILVTGGAGYIGSHVAWACLDAGRDVVVLDDLSTGLRELVPPQARFVEGAIGDRGLVARILSERPIGAVIHLAAKTVVPESLADPLAYYRTNFVDSLALIEAVAEAGVAAFVFSSTAAVYDPAAAAAGPLTESAPLAPLSPYGRTKLMVEALLADVGKVSPLRHVALRYFNVAGADPALRSGQSTPKATHLIKVACEVSAGLRPALEVYGDDYPTPDGSCVRDFVHVSDLAQAHLAALDHLEGGGESMTLNCGYGRGASVLEVAAAVERASGRSLPLLRAARREGDLVCAVSDPRRLKARLGWSPRYDTLDEIVASALRWEMIRAAGASRGVRRP